MLFKTILICNSENKETRIFMNSKILLIISILFSLFWAFSFQFFHFSNYYELSVDKIYFLYADANDYINSIELLLKN